MPGYIGDMRLKLSNAKQWNSIGKLTEAIKNGNGEVTPPNKVFDEEALSSNLSGQRHAAFELLSGNELSFIQ
jgi:hypothetical protein